jgi:hypothetical protein
MISAIQKLFERRCDCAANDLLADGELQFQVVFLTRDDELVVCAADMPDADRERDALVSILRLMAVAHDAVAAAITAEVWSDPDYRDGRRPSESPTRREALAVFVVYRDEEGTSLVQSEREIVRDSSGKIIELCAPKAPPTPGPCDESMGRLMRIMPRDRPSRHDRRLAKAMIDKLPSHLVHRMDCGDGMTLH